MFAHQIDTILTLDAATKTLYRGVYSMDKLPHRASGAYVINTDDSDEDGSHWIAVFVKNNTVEYMDSYGLPPLDSRCELFLGKDYYFNTCALQQLYSNACGFYCIYFLLQRARGYSADMIMNMLRQTDSGFVVKRYIYSRYKPVFN